MEIAGKQDNKDRVCQVPGCGTDLSAAAYYHRRHRVCPDHVKANVVFLGVDHCRFCQQCGHFHDLSRFKGSRRSCDESLAAHNARRRNVKLDLASFSCGGGSKGGSRGARGSSSSQRGGGATVSASVPAILKKQPKAGGSSTSSKQRVGKAASSAASAARDSPCYSAPANLQYNAAAAANSSDRLCHGWPPAAAAAAAMAGGLGSPSAVAEQLGDAVDANLGAFGGHARTQGAAAGAAAAAAASADDGSSSGSPCFSTNSAPVQLSGAVDNRHANTCSRQSFSCQQFVGWGGIQQPPPTAAFDMQAATTTTTITAAAAAAVDAAAAAIGGFCGAFLTPHTAAADNQQIAAQASRSRLALASGPGPLVLPLPPGLQQQQLGGQAMLNSHAAQPQGGCVFDDPIWGLLEQSPGSSAIKMDEVWGDGDDDAAATAAQPAAAAVGTSTAAEHAAAAQHVAGHQTSTNSSVASMPPHVKGEGALGAGSSATSQKQQPQQQDSRTLPQPTATAGLQPAWNQSAAMQPGSLHSWVPQTNTWGPPPPPAGASAAAAAASAVGLRQPGCETVAGMLCAPQQHGMLLQPAGWFTQQPQQYQSSAVAMQWQPPLQQQQQQQQNLVLPMHIQQGQLTVGMPCQQQLQVIPQQGLPQAVGGFSLSLKQEQAMAQGQVFQQQQHEVHTSAWMLPAHYPHQQMHVQGLQQAGTEAAMRQQQQQYMQQQQILSQQHQQQYMHQQFVEQQQYMQQQQVMSHHQHPSMPMQPALYQHFSAVQPYQQQQLQHQPHPGAVNPELPWGFMPPQAASQQPTQGLNTTQQQQQQVWMRDQQQQQPSGCLASCPVAATAAGQFPCSSSSSSPQAQLPAPGCALQPHSGGSQAVCRGPTDSTAAAAAAGGGGSAAAAAAAPATPMAAGAPLCEPSASPAHEAAQNAQLSEAAAAGDDGGGGAAAAGDACLPAAAADVAAPAADSAPDLDLLEQLLASAHSPHAMTLHESHNDLFGEGVDILLMPDHSHHLPPSHT